MDSLRGKEIAAAATTKEVYRLLNNITTHLSHPFRNKTFNQHRQIISIIFINSRHRLFSSLRISYTFHPPTPDTKETSNAKRRCDLAR